MQGGNISTTKWVSCLRTLTAAKMEVIPSPIVPKMPPAGGGIEALSALKTVAVI